MLSLCIYIIGSLLVIAIIYYWRNPKFNGKLPPGSMGWPLLGETFQFFAPNTPFDIHPFVKERMQRYGPIFQISLMGHPIIVSTDPDFNYFIFQQEGQLFQSCYPHTFSKIFGRENLGSLHGFMFKYLKNMVLNLFGPESLKNMLPEVENATNNNLKRLSGQTSVEMKEATAKGRKKIMKMLKRMLEERKLQPRKEQSDFFDYVLEELQREDTILTEAIALDLMFALLFASFETTSLAITLAIKFLHDHPLAHKQLTEEHEAIIRRRENASYGLTWQEYKSMKFTFQFINETVRLANIVPGIFRRALRDINFKGYTIPAGWTIMVCPPAVHLNPAEYEDPLHFNPWRWEGKEINGASRNFMAFGGGMRFCVGTDFAKVQMAVFLHCFVTKYKWETIKGGDIIRIPGLQFPNGYHIKISEKDHD